MSKVMKQAIVDHLTSTLDGVESAVVVNAGKMTVSESEELRNRFRAEDIKLLVIRNRLAGLAFAKTGFEGLESVLAGPSAMAFGGEGAIAISKIVVDYAKKVKNLEVLGGYIDGEVLDVDGVKKLATMPGRKELQSMVLQGLFGPVSDFASSMDNLLTEVHGLIEALEKKGGTDEP